MLLWFVKIYERNLKKLQFTTQCMFQIIMQINFFKYFANYYIGSNETFTVSSLYHIVDITCSFLQTTTQVKSNQKKYIICYTKSLIS